VKELDEAEQVVEEGWKIQFGNVSGQFIKHPVKIYLYPFSKSIVTDSRL